MTPRVIAVGDVHGCYNALLALLDAIQPRTEDVLVMLGDCIDRGPDSRGVVARLIQLGEECRLVSLLGNHEEMMLNHLAGKPQPDDWLECGGRETLASYDDGIVPPEHVEFIRHWDDYYETASHFFAHGGYHDSLPLDQQRWHIWRWHSLRHEVPRPHVSGKTAIVGHTSQKDGEILDVGYLKCIDTYCYGGGWLTALDTTSGQVWQANQAGQLRDRQTLCNEA